jgi:hypothetical protein
MDNTNVRSDQQPLQGGQQNIAGQQQHIQEHISDEAWQQLDEGRATYEKQYGQRTAQGTDGNSGTERNLDR